MCKSVFLRHDAERSSPWHIEKKSGLELGRMAFRPNGPTLYMRKSMGS